jgi:hypothetical protein
VYCTLHSRENWENLEVLSGDMSSSRRWPLPSWYDLLYSFDDFLWRRYDMLRFFVSLYL